jgi:hypothetical protein
MKQTRPAAVEPPAVLTLEEARDLLRATSNETAKRWLRTFAAAAILPGPKLRVSRLALLRIIEAGIPEALR